MAQMIQSTSNNKYSIGTVLKVFVIDGYLLFGSKFEDFLVFEADFDVYVIK
jgi:hypothetical protein